MVLKLYHDPSSPPSIAVRMGLHYLGLPCELIPVDFLTAQQASADFRKLNPQGEVPLLDDDGFLLSESVAILQYVAEKYKKDDILYPGDPKQRAIVNHLLCFHLSTYYNAIIQYVILPMSYAYKRTEIGLKKVNRAVELLDTILERSSGKYVAGENLTIADFPLLMGTMCLHGIDFDFCPYPRVQAWYEGFSKWHPELWKLSGDMVQVFKDWGKSGATLPHPFHPTDRANPQNVF